MKSTEILMFIVELSKWTCTSFVPIIYWFALLWGDDSPVSCSIHYFWPIPTVLFEERSGILEFSYQSHGTVTFRSNAGNCIAINEICDNTKDTALEFAKRNIPCASIASNLPQCPLTACTAPHCSLRPVQVLGRTSYLAQAFPRELPRSWRRHGLSCTIYAGSVVLSASSESASSEHMACTTADESLRGFKLNIIWKY